MYLLQRVTRNDDGTINVVVQSSVTNRMYDFNVLSVQAIAQALIDIVQTNDNLFLAIRLIVEGK